MKNRNTLSALFAVLILSISSANAGVLIEPVIGYNLKFDFKDDSGTEKGMGTSFGGRLGYQNLGLQLGLDYLKSSIKMDDDAYEENVSMGEWAAFVGYEFPVLLRVYAGYIFSATAETESGGSKVEFSEGSGSKLGVGFTGLPFVVVNFEYRTGNFEEGKSGGLTGDADLDYKAYMLSLSLPINL